MAQSLADRFRKHRIAMELARELGVTPKEAEAVMAQRAARARWELTRDRLAAKVRGNDARSVHVERAEPWYRQGDMA